MTAAHWHDLLARLSDAVIRADDVGQLPSALREAGWLGAPPAERQEIEKLERRLGHSLPPSYRSFLETTNGWFCLPPFLSTIWPAARVDWFVARNRDWVEAYNDPNTQSDPVSDEQYLDYSPDQDPVMLRTEYLYTALEVSDVGDSAVILLNPKIQTEEGEWEAWFFANWLPGAQRYRSFWELMEEKVRFYLDSEEQRLKLERKQFRKAVTVSPRARKRALKEARDAARRGEPDQAIPVLRKLADEGDDAACPSLAELLAFRGRWEELIPFASRLLANPNAVYAGNVVCTMVNLLGRAGDETQDWQVIGWAIQAAKMGIRKRVDPKKMDWNLGLMDRLQVYVDEQGIPKRAMVAEFQLLDGGGKEEDRRAAYRKLLDTVRTKNRHLRDNPLALHAEGIRSAVRFGLIKEALALHEARPLTDFRSGAMLARLLVERGDEELAWKILRAAIPHWSHVDLSQVAPADLLCDEYLRRILTRARCEEILLTPRGAAA